MCPAWIIDAKQIVEPFCLVAMSARSGVISAMIETKMARSHPRIMVIAGKCAVAIIRHVAIPVARLATETSLARSAKPNAASSVHILPATRNAANRARHAPKSDATRTVLIRRARCHVLRLAIGCRALNDVPRILLADASAHLSAVKRVQTSSSARIAPVMR